MENDYSRLSHNFAELARVSLSGNTAAVYTFLVGVANEYRRSDPNLSQAMTALCRLSPARPEPWKRTSVVQDKQDQPR